MKNKIETPGVAMKYPFIKTTFAALCLLGGSLATGAASAATCNFGSGGSDSLQSILDNITTAPVPGDSSVDVTTDCLADANDSYWSIEGSGGSIATFIVEIAGQASTNTLGIYDATDSTNFVQLFSGADTAGSQVRVSILADGSVFVNGADSGNDFASINLFGYYLGSASDSPTYFSDTGLNPDGGDHMFAYAGKGDTIQISPYAPGVWPDDSYILAWEDLPVAPSNGLSNSCSGDCITYGDGDYNDLVLYVESVQPVPVPAAVWLFGSGLLGLVGIARRRKA